LISLWFVGFSYAGQRQNMPASLASEAKGRGFDPRQPHHHIRQDHSELRLSAMLGWFNASFAFCPPSSGI
jgi:hypothetical protein